MTAEIVILNWNGRDHLRTFLPSVVAAAPAGVGVTVADNGSTDDSAEVLAREFPTVRVVRLGRNYGFAEGYNRALREVDAECFVLLNSDVETPAGWLEPLLEVLEREPDVAAVAPKLRSWRDRASFEYAGAAGGYLDLLGYPFCRGRILRCVERDEGQYDDERDVFWVSGAAFCCRAEVFRELGGFDASFFAHMEEIDLCWRMQLAGFKIATVTNSTVSHLGGASLDASDPKKTYLNFRNNLLMMHRNLPRRIAKKRLIVRRLLDTLAWARFIATFKWRHAGAIVCAHHDFARMRKDMATAPDDAPDMLRTGTNRPLSILHHNYLLGHRRFTQL